MWHRPVVPKSASHAARSTARMRMHTARRRKRRRSASLRAGRQRRMDREPPGEGRSDAKALGEESERGEGGTYGPKEESEGMERSGGTGGRTGARAGYY